METKAMQKNNQSQAKPSALARMASRLEVDANKLLETLKATVFQKATNEELLALVTVANEYGLNPFLKELYAFPAKGGGIVPIVSVDGWNKMLIRQEQFDGIEFEFSDDNEGNPYSCTATIHVKGRAHPVKITEFLSECKRNTDPWNNMPRRMLRNRTLCQASRIAFGFSGVYSDDEAAAVTVEATVMPAEPPKIIAAPAPDKRTPQKDLEAWCLAEGFTLDHFLAFAPSQGFEAADSVTTFDEIPAELAKRMLRAPDGLRTKLAEIKEGK